MNFFGGNFALFFFTFRTPALGILPRRPCLTFGRTASTVAAGARETEWSSPFGWECANCREGSTVLAVLLLFRFK